MTEQNDEVEIQSLSVKSPAATHTSKIHVHRSMNSEGSEVQLYET